MRNVYENVPSNQIEKQKRYLYGALINILYLYDDNRFNPGRKQHYLVLPNGIGVYDSEGEATLLDTFILQENIVIPNHKVYISEWGTSNIGGLLLY